MGNDVVSGAFGAAQQKCTAHCVAPECERIDCNPCKQASRPELDAVAEGRTKFDVQEVNLSRTPQTYEAEPSEEPGPDWLSDYLKDKGLLADLPRHQQNSTDLRSRAIRGARTRLVVGLP